MEYTLYISSFTPNAGSVMGGTEVDIYGEGFRFFIYNLNKTINILSKFQLNFSQNCSENIISFGNQNCDIIECTSQSVKCKTSYANNIYQITNNGVDACKIFEN
jgi:hypothetical protein